MSRNLASTSCRICNESRVILDEPARLITEADAGGCYPRYAGLLQVANATCELCGAKYLAWVAVVPGSTMDHGHWRRDAHDTRTFVDLSFRSTFDDEPGPADLPEPAVLRRLHAAACLQRARNLQAQANDLLNEAYKETIKAYRDEPFWEGYRRL